VLIHQPLVRERLFHRVEVGALDVLDQRQFQQFPGVHLPDDHRYRRQSGQPRRLQTALAGHQPVRPTLAPRHHQRLDHPMLANRGRQLLEQRRIEGRARLLRVGRDQVDVHLRRPTADRRPCFGFHRCWRRRSRDERIEPAAKPSPRVRHAGTSTRARSSEARPWYASAARPAGSYRKIVCP
jgi:hypothetical protein